MIIVLKSQVWGWPGESEWTDSTHVKIWPSKEEWALGVEEPGQ